jgi:hypothetical protein
VKVKISEIDAGEIQAEEYSDIFTVETIGPEAEMIITFEYWPPDAILEGLPFCKQYNITACTFLTGDGDNTNDCIKKNITVSWGYTRQNAINRINALKQYVINKDLDNGALQPLRNHLTQAADKVDMNQIYQAIDKMHGFIQQVEIKRETHEIPDYEADYLIAVANEIIQCLLHHCFSD